MLALKRGWRSHPHTGACWLHLRLTLPRPPHKACPSSTLVTSTLQTSVLLFRSPSLRPPGMGARPLEFARGHGSKRQFEFRAFGSFSAQSLPRPGRGGQPPQQLAHLARLGCPPHAAGALVRRLCLTHLPDSAPGRLSSARTVLSRPVVLDFASVTPASPQHLPTGSLAIPALSTLSVTAARGAPVSPVPAAFNLRGKVSWSDAFTTLRWRLLASERAGWQATATTMDVRRAPFTTLYSPGSTSSGPFAKSAFQEVPVNTQQANSMSAEAGKAFAALDVNQQQQQQQTEARGEAAQGARGFQMVVAVGEDWGMGISGRMPWEAAGQRLPGDLARFKDITTSIQKGSGGSTTGAGAGKVKPRNAVIMGRLTFESLPPKMRPLPGRLNIVLSRQASGTHEAQQETEGGPVDLIYCSSLDAALRLLGTGPWKDSVQSVFVIGGAQIYKEAILSPLCEAVHVTTVHTEYPADIFFPHPEELRRSFRVWCAAPRQVDNGVATSFTCYVRAEPQFQAQLQQPAGAEAQAASGAPGASPASDAWTQGGGKREGPTERKENTGGAPGSKAGPTEGQKRAGGAQGEAEVAARLPASVRGMHDEYQYLDLVRNIMLLGASKGDRTGTGTLSLFGKQMRFDLRHTFPLLTTKRVFWRGVVEELLWFIAGSTDANLLREKGVHIWDGNGSRQFLDSLGFTDREEGDLGPVYGFQWRHFGAEYRGMREDYSGQGVDQLAEVVHKLRHKPEDRRIILSAWNPAALHLMALPPCHLLSQFYVADGELTCQLYQRSCDMGLGVPFNIASYALLTCMLAHVCGLVPGELVHTLGDAHVYKNHVEPLNQQLLNAPRPFPVLRIKRDVKDIDGFRADDFELLGYKPHKKIAMDMAV